MLEARQKPKSCEQQDMLSDFTSQGKLQGDSTNIFLILEECKRLISTAKLAAVIRMTFAGETPAKDLLELNSISII